jgi:hypothetical protein
MVPTIHMQQATRSREQLWTLSKDDRSMMAELFQGRQRYEVRFFSSEHCFASHALGSRELAVRYASAIHHHLIASGWVTAAS